MSVIMYTKNGCPYCEAAKESYKKRNIDFIEINITEHPEKISELLELAGVRKVPVINDKGAITVGFNGDG